VSNEKNDGKKSRGVNKKLVAGAVLSAAIIALVVFSLAEREVREKAGAPGRAAVKPADTGSMAVSTAPDTARKKETEKTNETTSHHETPSIKSAARAAALAASALRYPKDRTASIAAGKKDTARGMASDTSTSRDTAAKKTLTEGAETAAAANSTMPPESISNNCAGDTLAPWVYLDPSGGLHRGTVAVVFAANKPCDISWRFEPDTAWQIWSGAPLAVERTATIAFKAIDRCGRAMAARLEYYEITSERTDSLCPRDMELVKIGATQFCIDRYEWPNRKGALPQSYISQYGARDSCFTAGKRLCSSEEWSLACSGPYSWNYPYGQEYERYACVTHDTTVRPSGSKPECRAFFGTFDMSGNLLEWTSTPSKDNPQFFNVMGGFWQSGPRSGCFDTRYSYFPQNRHNPVGFRCCKEIAPVKK
jgi:hypothetical protein